jgi:hypothetical protein
VNIEYRQLVEVLEPKYRALVAMTPVRYTSLPRAMPKCGVYLFSEGDNHLYVGRFNHMRQRLAGHCRPSSSHFSATFAFRVARERTGFKATYSTEGSRPLLVKHKAFGPEFMRAKAWIAGLDLRFIEETEQIRQALLEIYPAVVLKTSFNAFNTH